MAMAARAMRDTTHRKPLAFVLNERPGVSRYVQLADYVRHKITRGDWAPGSRLPTVQALAQELGVARITVRQAYAMLVAESLIVSERGRGTRVRENVGPHAADVRAAINSWLDVPDGFEIRILRKRIGVKLPEDLQLAGAPSGRYVHLRKSHAHSKKIFFVSDMYVAAEVFARLPPRSEEHSKVTGLLCRYAPELMKNLRQVFTVGQADAALAKMLGCTFGAAVAQVRRTVTSDAGDIVYAATTRYQGEHFNLDMTLPVSVVYRPSQA